MNTYYAPESKIVRRLREAEGEVERLRDELAAEREAFRTLSAERDRWVDRSGREAAELAAVRAAVTGEPVAADASELVKRVALLAGLVDEVDHMWTPAEDDGLTDADRDAGWRWDAKGPYLMLLDDAGDARAAVTIHGWNTDYTVNGRAAFRRGPETGAAGQRAAVRALRKAGVMPGGERSGA